MVDKGKKKKPDGANFQERLLGLARHFDDQTKVRWQPLCDSGNRIDTARHACARPTLLEPVLLLSLQFLFFFFQQRTMSRADDGRTSHDDNIMTTTTTKIVLYVIITFIIHRWCIAVTIIRYISLRGSIMVQVGAV